MKRATTFLLGLGIVITLGGMVMWYGPLLRQLIKPHLIRSASQDQTQTTAKAQDMNLNAKASEFAYPDLGITAPIVDMRQQDPFAESDWNSIRATLRQGIGITYPHPDDATFFTNSPGAAALYPNVSNDSTALATIPTVYLLGHSSDVYPNPYAYTFAGLPQAKKGDVFYLMLDGELTRFSVTDIQIVQPNDQHAFASFTNTNTHIQRAVLVTCYPILTSSKRLIVIGERSL